MMAADSDCLLVASVAPLSRIGLFVRERPLVERDVAVVDLGFVAPSRYAGIVDWLRDGRRLSTRVAR